MTATTDSREAPAATVGVLGAGSWGTALAILLARNGHAVRLWGRDAGTVARLAAARCNDRFLPGFEFPPGLQPRAAGGARMLVIAVPSQGAVALLERLAAMPVRPHGIVSAAKGFVDDGRLLDERVAATLGAAGRRGARLPGERPARLGGSRAQRVLGPW